MFAGFLTLILAFAGTALAASGDAEGGFGAFDLVLIVGLGAGAILLVLGLVGKHNGRGGKQAGTLAIIGAVVLVGTGVVWVFSSMSPPEEGSTGGAKAAAVSDLGTAQYAQVIDLTVVVRDPAEGTAVASADVHLWKNESAYSAAQLYTRSAPSIISCTTDSAGQCTLKAIPAAVYDLCAYKTGYYTVQLSKPEQSSCQFGVASTTKVPYNANTGVGAFTLTPALALQQHPTLDLTKTSTTIGSSGCAAGTSTCPLTIFFGNDKAKSIAAYPAVKLTPKVTSSSATTNNLTFASLQTGSGCQYAIVNQATYVYDPNLDVLAAKQWGSCGVNLNYLTGSADAKIGLTLDDGFIPRMYAAMGTKIPTGDFETNSVWNNVAAVTLDVTR